MIIKPEDWSKEPSFQDDDYLGLIRNLCACFTSYNEKEVHASGTCVRIARCLYLTAKHVVEDLVAALGLTIIGKTDSAKLLGYVAISEPGEPAHLRNADSHGYFGGGGQHGLKGRGDGVPVFQAGLIDFAGHILGDLDGFGHGAALCHQTGHLLTGGHVAAFFERFQVEFDEGFRHETPS